MAAQRFVCVGTYLGFHQQTFFPKQVGESYEMPELLNPLKQHRERMTIFSGLDHRGRNGHEGWKAWLTGSATGSHSVDQMIADQIGANTRYASLQLTCGNPPGDAKMSFTREGVALPMIGRPSVLFKTLFRSDSDRHRIEYLLDSNRSVIDEVLDEVGTLSRNASERDRTKLNQYLASLRDVEKKLQKQKSWLDVPTPKVDYKLPEFDPVAPALALECETIMYDLMTLSLTTDSTRVLTFLVPGWSQVFELDGQKLSAGYHGLSHHGNDPAKIDEYNRVGLEHIKRFASFVDRLADAEDAIGRPLLNTTTLMFGSGMGDSNTHDNSNLPTLVLGGGLNHGNHHQINREGSKARMLGDLYLTVLQRFGVEADEFVNAKNNMSEYLL